MSYTTRRNFLATTSAALAASFFRTHGANAQPLSPAVLRAGRSARQLLPAPIAPSVLHSLATTALDAARQAGASYADVRVGERHVLSIVSTVPPLLAIRSTLSYGVRAMVNGASAFSYGSTPTSDAIAATARDAVSTARSYAAFLTHPVEWAPVPVATGTWATPVLEDPFAVPLDDHVAAAYAYTLAGNHVKRVAMNPQSIFHWTKETRIFVSSEGGLTTQRVCGLHPFINCFSGYVDPNNGGVWMSFPGAVARAGGFELANNPAIQDNIKRWTEDVAWMSSLPRGTLDVGRYPVIFAGAAAGTLLGTTLGRALELDRALGDDAGTSGTSVLRAPLELLGTQIASPQLSVTAGRGMPSACAVQWDDEGVETRDYPLITNGQLVDYHSSRTTAPALRRWYEQHGRPVRSTGTAVAPEADNPVQVRAPELRITPSSAPTSLETLCQDVSHGILLMATESNDLRTDHALSSAYYAMQPYAGQPALEIVRGKPVRRVIANALDVSTKRCWKDQLVAIGDATTVCANTFEVNKGLPWHASVQCTSTPAVLFKDVNVSAFSGRSPQF